MKKNNNQIAGVTAKILTGPQTIVYFEVMIAPKSGEPDFLACWARLEIHERKLYREGYGSFSNYVRTRWGMSRSRAYLLMRYARLR